MLKCNTFYINKHKCVAITNGGRINKFSTHRGPKNLSINVTFTVWSACSAKLESSLGGNDMPHASAKSLSSFSTAVIFPLNICTFYL